MFIPIVHLLFVSQGPEWVWLMGYYIRSRLIMSQRLAKLDLTNKPAIAQAIRESQEILLRLNNHIRNSPWRSLPELTQVNGEVSSFLIFHIFAIILCTNI